MDVGRVRAHGPILRRSRRKAGRDGGGAAAALVLRVGRAPRAVLRLPGRAGLAAAVSTVPVWTGGYSRAAIRRASAQSDGWVGVASTEEAGEKILGELFAGLRAHGREASPFDIPLSLPIPVTAAVVERWAERGVTGLIVRPWAGVLDGELGGLASAQGADLDRKIAAAQRFGAEVIATVRPPPGKPRS